MKGKVLQKRCSKRWVVSPEVGRQSQGMDRPGVRQVPEGGGEHRKVKGNGCEVICGAPAPLTVKGIGESVKVKV